MEETHISCDFYFFSKSDEIIHWALRFLNDPLANITTIVDTPWSIVLKINSGNENYYLKSMPALIALEARIIQILHDEFNAAVPQVVAINSELHCFLMKDSGKSLREILKKQFDIALLCKAIDQFTLLQVLTAKNIKIFIDIGVPDWRLGKMPDLFGSLIFKKDFLLEDGLSEVEIIELERLLPNIFGLCEKLSEYAIKETIVQPDFNDNNTLIDEASKDITIIDLGEISISHPFFSLLNCLRQIKKHYGLVETDAAYATIKEACLKNYRKFESEKYLLEALDLAQILWPIYQSLAYYRLMEACDPQNIMSFQRGKISQILKELVALITEDTSKRC